MKRHFYVSEDLDDLDRIEVELENRGVHRPQIHVFSRDDTAVETHDHLHNIESVFKKDVVHGIIVGTWIGIVLAALVLIITAYSNWPEAYTWMPFIFLALVLFGFSIWSGGLYGIQVPHRDFKRFEAQLREGKHVFIVDVDPEQESSLARVVERHPGLQLAGTGRATPRWIVMGQHNIKKFTSETFP
ncbi:MAG: NAD/FAD-utilizing enzyme [Gammaproteobacteria bacterium]|nr:NAD/FAD-utilizing enzyme [Gammaproteobacteria bacterium]MBT8437242.1 NAD/FAD-utilizing enzyme [Gammaproteobacteria bacterium]